MKHDIYLISVLFLGIIGSISIVEAQRCPTENLSPCSCAITSSFGIEVRCTYVPMDEVKAIFDNIPPFDFDRLSLNVVNTDDLVNVTETIPENLVGQARFKRLDITSYRRLVEVDPDAFRSSSNTLIELYLWDLDMSPPFNFSFIEGFELLAKLKFQYNINVVRTFATLPSFLPALNEVTCYYSTGLNEEWQSTNNAILQSRVGLVKLDFFRCDLNDRGMNQFIDWVLPSSNESLKTFTIYQDAQVSSIPQKFGSFQSLTDFQLAFNRAELTIPSNSVFIPGITSSKVDLEQSNVILVESDAFNGNYGSAYVNLKTNKLTRFEEASFKSMLQFMSVGSGSLSVSSNPFDCDSDPCHLAWLLRDNRNLLTKLFNSARCSDGRYFEYLPPSLFADCP